jgi:uncharacterized membrane protein YqgA involved in biofilm formation
VLGTIVNALAILVGSGLVLITGLRMPEKYNETVIKSISLAVVLIGIMNALEVNDLMLVIFSLAIGSFIGEFLDIEERLENLGQMVEKRFSNMGDGIAKGFVTASLLYCVGSMAIVGSLESGLTNNHETLFAKSVLDGISSIIFTSSFGIGVLFSAIPVFLYQGLITLTASFMKQFLIDSVVADMTAVGGLLIIAIGLNILEVKKIKVGNMLPAIFIPLAYFIIRSAFGL